MNKLSEQQTQLTHSLGYKASTPLWQRVPTKDDQGKLLADFMIIIPKLNKQPSYVISKTIQKLQIALQQHDETVFFADLNIRINILWISYQARKGKCIDIATTIINAVPEAKLIAERQ